MNAFRREFIATSLWRVIAVLTLGLAILISFLGSPFGAMVIALVGWLLLTPLFLFWGEDIARGVYGEAADETQRDQDPVETLKHRYALGEIDDAEFEARLDRLLELE